MAELKSVVAGAPRDWRLEIVRKAVRHIYFRVYPEQKLVKISAPRRVSRDDLDTAIRDRSPWMLKQIKKSRPAPRPGALLPDHGKLRFRGRQYPLNFIDGQPPRVGFDPDKGVVVQTRPGAARDKKAAVLEGWLRQCLKGDIRELLDKWEPVMGVRASDFGVKKMKTRWGSCNTRVGRIWINFALIRLAPWLLEYVLVHELSHLLEPSHNRRFYGIMDQFLPGWKNCRAELDQYSPRAMG
ncbi:MAG: M48 family metallopeptidase [Desulfobacter sp.]|nr:MAG: M48 family metallopeptidase [Desulfobacter sp.]